MLPASTHQLQSEAAKLSWSIPSIREARLKGLRSPENRLRASAIMKSIRARMAWKSPPGGGRKKKLEAKDKWIKVRGEWVNNA